MAGSTQKRLDLIWTWKSEISTGYSKLTKAISRTKKEFIELSKTNVANTKAFNKASEALTHLDSLMEKFKGSMSTMASQIKSSQKQIDKLNEAKKRLSYTVSGLRKRTENLKIKVAQLKAEQKLYVKEINRLLKNEGKQQASIENLNKRIKQQSELIRKQGAMLRKLAKEKDKVVVKTKKETKAHQTQIKSIFNLNKAFDKLAKKQRTYEINSERIRGRTDGLRRKIGALRNQILLMVFAFSGLFRLFKSSIEASNELENSYVGLRAVTDKTGESFIKAKRFAEEFTKSGLIKVTTVTTGLKNLLSAGFGMDQAIDLLKAGADAAAFNRQGTLSLSEAIIGYTQGIKNQNSIMTDNAGITKNLSIMYDEYARSIGTTRGKLTEAQKRQAIYNGMMKEAAIYQGNLNKLTEVYTGKTEKLSLSIFKAKALLGDFLKSGLKGTLNTISEIINKIYEWIKANELFIKTDITTSLKMFGDVIKTVKIGVVSLIDGIKNLVSLFGLFNISTKKTIAILGSLYISFRLVGKGILIYEALVKRIGKLSIVTLAYAKYLRAVKIWAGMSGKAMGFLSKMVIGARIAFQALGGWITVIIAALGGLIYLWYRYREAQSKAIEEQKKLNELARERIRNNADEADSLMKDLQSRLKNINLTKDERKALEEKLRVQKEIAMFTREEEGAARIQDRIDKLNEEIAKIKEKGVTEANVVLFGKLNEQLANFEYYKRLVEDFNIKDRKGKQEVINQLEKQIDLENTKFYNLSQQKETNEIILKDSEKRVGQLKQEIKVFERQRAALVERIGILKSLEQTQGKLSREQHSELKTALKKTSVLTGQIYKREKEVEQLTNTRKLTKDELKDLENKISQTEKLINQEESRLEIYKKIEQSGKELSKTQETDKLFSKAKLDSYKKQLENLEKMRSSGQINLKITKDEIRALKDSTESTSDRLKVMKEVLSTLKFILGIDKQINEEEKKQEEKLKKINQALNALKRLRDTLKGKIEGLGLYGMEKELHNFEVSIRRIKRRLTELAEKVKGSKEGQNLVNEVKGLLKQWEDLGGKDLENRLLESGERSLKKLEAKAKDVQLKVKVKEVLDDSSFEVGNNKFMEVPVRIKLQFIQGANLSGYESQVQEVANKIKDLIKEQTSLQNAIDSGKDYEARQKRIEQIKQEIKYMKQSLDITAKMWEAHAKFINTIQDNITQLENAIPANTIWGKYSRQLDQVTEKEKRSISGRIVVYAKFAKMLQIQKDNRIITEEQYNEKIKELKRNLAEETVAIEQEASLRRRNIIYQEVTETMNAIENMLGGWQNLGAFLYDYYEGQDKAQEARLKRQKELLKRGQITEQQFADRRRQIEEATRKDRERAEARFWANVIRQAGLAAQQALLQAAAAQIANSGVLNSTAQLTSAFYSLQAKIAAGLSIIPGLEYYGIIAQALQTAATASSASGSLAMGAGLALAGIGIGVGTGALAAGIEANNPGSEGGFLGTPTEDTFEDRKKKLGGSIKAQEVHLSINPVTYIQAEGDIYIGEGITIDTFRGLVNEAFVNRAQEALETGELEIDQIITKEG